MRILCCLTSFLRISPKELLVGIWLSELKYTVAMAFTFHSSIMLYRNGTLDLLQSSSLSPPQFKNLPQSLLRSGLSLSGFHLFDFVGGGRDEWRRGWARRRRRTRLQIDSKRRSGLSRVLWIRIQGFRSPVHWHRQQRGTQLCENSNISDKHVIYITRFTIMPYATNL